MKLKRIILLTFISSILSGCIANVDRTQASDLDKYSGKLIRSNIVVGKSTKKDLLLMLGAPSTPVNFITANNWAYVSRVVDRRLYFFIPVFMDRDQLLLLEFNSDGVVIKMNYSEK